MRIQARLLLSQDIFSLLKNPTTCCCGWEEDGRVDEVVTVGDGLCATRR